MATASISYLIWVETRNEIAPYVRNKARLRLIALGLIETGFIYFAVQLSYSVVIAVTWYQYTHGDGNPSNDVNWAFSIISAFSSMIPVSWLSTSPLVCGRFAHQASLLGNSANTYCC